MPGSQVSVSHFDSPVASHSHWVWFAMVVLQSRPPLSPTGFAPTIDSDAAPNCAAGRPAVFPTSAPATPSRRASGAALAQAPHPVAHRLARAVVARSAQPERHSPPAAPTRDMQRAGGPRRLGQEQPAVESRNRDHARAAAAGDPSDQAADAVQRQPAPTELPALGGMHKHDVAAGGRRSRATNTAATAMSPATLSENAAPKPGPILPASSGPGRPPIATPTRLGVTASTGCESAIASGSCGSQGAVERRVIALWVPSHP